MTDTDVIRVSWHDCNCEWTTKYCDEYHVKSALVPREYLADLAAKQERQSRETDA